MLELEPDPSTGKRRQKWITVKGTKKEAERELARLLNQWANGTYVEPAKLTLAEFLERWLHDYVEPNCAPKTQRAYRQFAQHIVKSIGTVSLEKLRPGHVLKLLGDLRTAPRADGKTGTLSPTTQHHVYRVLHNALEHAVQWEMLPTNPCSKVDPPRAARHEMQTLTPEQVRTLLAAAEAESPHWHAFIGLAVLTGMRLGELLALRWADVDLEKGTLTVARSAQYLSGHGVIVREPKTARSRRSVAIPPLAVSLLRKHRHAQDALRDLLGSAWRDDDLVFPNTFGGLKDESKVRRAFRRLLKQAGLPSTVRLHDLRHTSASLALLAGTNPKIVSERLGHTSVQVTLDRYSHVLPTLRAQAAQLLERVILVDGDQSDYPTVSPTTESRSVKAEDVAI